MSQTKKQTRKLFRDTVFARDGHKCRVCFQVEKPDCHLDAHHITDRNKMPSGGYVLENGISLCPRCHDKAEDFHRTNGEFVEDGYEPEHLYNLIGSSLSLAWRASGTKALKDIPDEIS